MKKGKKLQKDSETFDESKNIDTSENHDDESCHCDEIHVVSAKHNKSHASIDAMVDIIISLIFKIAAEKKSLDKTREELDDFLQDDIDELI
ncbi:MAG: hypothetical protein WAT71_17690 [Ignavibacteria bacterium]